jgi:hypothetical protein
MPHWEGIEDSSQEPAAVWLARRKKDLPTAAAAATTTTVEHWKPLRKADCKRLNDACGSSSSSNNNNIAGNSSSSLVGGSDDDADDSKIKDGRNAVYIEGGRCRVDLKEMTIRHNFVERGPIRELCSAVWFERHDRGKEGIVLLPIVNDEDSVRIETLYQKAVQAMSSLGSGIDALLATLLSSSEQQHQHSIEIDDGASKLKLQKTGDVLTIRKVPTAGWFKNSVVLQRGYGPYSVDGEEWEEALGPVSQCIFVVHGIGEALFSRDNVKVGSLVDQADAARIELHRRQHADWMKRKNDSKADSAADPLAPPGRIELVPIEWYSHIHDSSSSLMRSLQATTLRTIPALRAIANDVVFDVLMYLTPSFCTSVLETVTRQICDLHDRFHRVHPGYGGTFALAGHSLGSVICWDLLALLKQSDPVRFSSPQEQRQSPPSPALGVPGPPSSSPSSSTNASELGAPTGYQAYAQNEHADRAQNGSWGPAVTKTLPTIPFVPESTFFLGSPLGIFLTLRGAHPVFDELRKQQQPQPSAVSDGGGGGGGLQAAVSPFTLPTENLYNIYHPRCVRVCIVCR